MTNIYIYCIVDSKEEIRSLRLAANRYWDALRFIGNRVAIREDEFEEIVRKAGVRPKIVGKGDGYLFWIKHGAIIK